MIESDLFYAFKEEFYAFLAKKDHPNCIIKALAALEGKTVTIETLYEKILAPALNDLTAKEDDLLEVAIWNEHIRSGIIRSIIECISPQVFALQKEQQLLSSAPIKKIVLVSPGGELHDLGSRMGADFFRIAGMEAIFVGANTPDRDILNGIALVRPDYVVINVVNYFHLFKVKQVIQQMKQLYPQVKVLGSGSAFKNRKEILSALGVEGFIDSMADVLTLKEVAL